IAKAYLIAALLHQNKGRSGFQEIVETEDALPRADAAKLIVHLAIAARRETQEEKAMSVPYLWSIFLRLTNERAMIEAAAAHLDTNDPKLKSYLQQLLDHKLRGERKGRPFGAIT